MYHYYQLSLFIYKNICFFNYLHTYLRRITNDALTFWKKFLSVILHEGKRANISPPLSFRKFALKPPVIRIAPKVYFFINLYRSKAA